MRRPLICANWKMNHTLSDAFDFFEKFKFTPKKFPSVDVVVFPPAIIIQPLLPVAEKMGIPLGGQNVNENASGAFTGEISAKMLKSVGAKWVIIGHSERRNIFNESDDTIAKKIHSALSEDLKVILCVGEQLSTREEGKTIDFIKDQLTVDLKPVKSDDMKLVTIAYEPIWAIGTGRASEPGDADETMAFLRKWLSKRFSPEIADSTRILYGGSVKASNMGEYIKMENIDGALVGGASLDAESFMGIVKGAG
jgi:triosephosphate isomerase